MISVSLIYNRKNVAGATAGIEVRITYARKSYYISTGVRVHSNEWRNGQIIKRPDCIELNERLSLLVTNIQNEVNACLRDGRPIDVKVIKQRAWNSQSSGCHEVEKWIADTIPMLNLAPKTQERYLIVLKAMKDFGRFCYWSDVTTENLYAFDSWLHQRPSQDGISHISDSGVYNYHKCLKALLNRAVKIGVIDSNPYHRLRGEFKKGEHESFEYLTEDEMAAFEALSPVRGTVAARTRDLFVFQMYTGLSYSDAQAFDIANYKLIDGKWCYNGRRIKTGSPYVSELLPPVVDVLARNGWKVPHVSNWYYNHTLKVLAAKAGIKTRVHSHLARHTFATWVLSKHVEIQNLRQMLGHKDIRHTQRYAKVLAESVHAEYDKLSDILDK